MRECVSSRHDRYSSLRDRSLSSAFYREAVEALDPDDEIRARSMNIGRPIGIDATSLWARGYSHASGFQLVRHFRIAVACLL
jgi:hypothetical protein